MLQAEARMRLLIAYGREFTRPRPFRLLRWIAGRPEPPGPEAPVQRNG